MAWLVPSSLLDASPRCQQLLHASASACPAVEPSMRLPGFSMGVPHKCGERSSSDLSRWVGQLDTLTFSTALGDE